MPTAITDEDLRALARQVVDLWQSQGTPLTSALVTVLGPQRKTLTPHHVRRVSEFTHHRAFESQFYKKPGVISYDPPDADKAIEQLYGNKEASAPMTTAPARSTPLLPMQSRTSSLTKVASAPEPEHYAPEVWRGVIDLLTRTQEEAASRVVVASHDFRQEFDRTLRQDPDATIGDALLLVTNTVDPDWITRELEDVTARAVSEGWPTGADKRASATDLRGFNYDHPLAKCASALVEARMAYETSVANRKAAIHDMEQQKVAQQCAPGMAPRRNNLTAEEMENAIPLAKAPEHTRRIAHAWNSHPLNKDRQATYISHQGTHYKVAAIFGHQEPRVSDGEVPYETRKRWMQDYAKKKAVEQPSDTGTAMLTGAGIGGALGALVGATHAARGAGTRGALVGGVVGAGVGGLSGWSLKHNDDAAISGAKEMLNGKLEDHLADRIVAQKRRRESDQYWREERRHQDLMSALRPRAWR